MIATGRLDKEMCCGNCAFWNAPVDPKNMPKHRGDLRTAECRRRSPNYGNDTNDNWGIVYENDWCGEFMHVANLYVSA